MSKDKKKELEGVEEMEAAADDSGLDLERFGEIIDGFLKKNRVQMLMTMEEGTLDAKLEDNIGGGPVLQFYFLLNAFKPVWLGMREYLEPSLEEECIDAMLGLVKDELMEAAKAAGEEEEDGSGGED